MKGRRVGCARVLSIQALESSLQAVSKAVRALAGYRPRPLLRTLLMYYTRIRPHSKQPTVSQPLPRRRTAYTLHNALRVTAGDAEDTREDQEFLISALSASPREYQDPAAKSSPSHVIVRFAYFEEDAGRSAAETPGEGRIRAAARARTVRRAEIMPAALAG